MTCAKKRVVAVLVGRSGRVYIGDNRVEQPQDACPREAGDGYEKCLSVCAQPGHAEIVALQKAGDDARGGEIVVIGHDYICEGCTHALHAAGVRSATLWP